MGASTTIWLAATLTLGAGPLKDPLPAELTRTPAPAASSSAAADTPAVPRLLPEDTTSVRMRVRRLSHQLAQHFRALPGEGRLQTVAVLEFTSEGDEARRREVGRIVSAELASDLRRDHRLNLVEREKIDAALREGFLNELGLVDEATAVKLGELLSAQALIVGSVSQAGEEFLVNARIVSTETGEVFAAEQEALPAAGLISYASDAVVLRTRSGAVFRSLVMPGWGQIYNRQEAKGWTVLALEAAALAAALSFQVAGGRAHARYLSAAEVDAQQRHLDAERTLYTARNGALIAGAAVWIFGGVDALAYGRTFDPARAGD